MVTIAKGAWLQEQLGSAISLAAAPPTDSELSATELRDMESVADEVCMNSRAFTYKELKDEQPVPVPVPVVVPVLAAPVRDHLPWSLFNLAYMNCCCMGLIATIYSVKSRDRKFLGDVEGGLHYGSTARSFNIAATTLSILVILIMIVYVLVGVLSL
ncbi:dispanin subfamily A member 2b-like [Amblyraja radiata]|uniref:dispanin subfamily A member 2b-like n=1 Tax=Amblyraja radiata TaxID=386614 RepID=UPI001401C745|nr:dispanin subfamily A member 2b-like [Amblyraja radiata]